MLYEMLAGEVPFKAETPLKLFEKICYDEPKPVSKVVPGIPKDVAKLIDKMMAKDRDDRYATCAALVADIDRVERGEKVKINSRKRMRAARGRRGRRGGLYPAAVAAGIIALAAVAYVYVKGGQGVPARDAEPGGSADVASSHQTTPAAGVPNAKKRRIVLVRDFDNSTGKGDLEWLEVGIADMLITDLAGCEYLEVMSRDKARDIVAKGVKPGPGLVDIEVKGSFAEAGGKLLIIAKVVDVEGGAVLKAVKMSGSVEGIFKLIDSVSTSIRRDLQTVLAERLGGEVELASSGGVESRLFLANAPESRNMIARRRTRRAADGRLAEKKRQSLQKPGAEARVPNELGKADKKSGMDATGKRSDARQDRGRAVEGESARRRNRPYGMRPSAPGRPLKDEDVAAVGAGPAGGGGGGMPASASARKAASEASEAPEAPEATDAADMEFRGGARGDAAPTGLAARVAQAKVKQGKVAEKQMNLAAANDKVAGTAEPKGRPVDPTDMHKRVAGVSLYYRARNILDDPDATPEELAKAMKMLSTAKELTPGLRRLDQAIDSCRRRLPQRGF